MGRRVVPSLLVLAGLLASAASASADTGARATAAAPSRLLVIAEEFRFALSRRSVRAGPIVIQLENRGEDPHDLQMRRLNRRGRGVGPTLVVGETASGALTELDATTRRGQWRLWCSLPGHRRLGMRATLKAR